VPTGLLDYFPDALAAVSEVSLQGQRSTIRASRCTTPAASRWITPTASRHLTERGGFDGDIRHTAALAWRALALLQEELEGELLLAAAPRREGVNYRDGNTHSTSLDDSFWQRWYRANPRTWNSDGAMRPWEIHATEYGDKVYVYVAPTDGEPFILEDSKPLFPSDALMAALHLREKSK
jgi:hypothetical protein